MWEFILSILERLGAPAGWITAIVQLLIWIIGAPIFYVRYRRRVSELEQRVSKLEYTVAEHEQEIAEMKDLATAWFQMTKEAVSMMKARAPKVYRDYVSSYGGEQKFTDWWRVPKIPGVESKSIEEETEETGG